MRNCVGFCDDREFIVGQGMVGIVLIAGQKPQGILTEGIVHRMG